MVIFQYNLYIFGIHLWTMLYPKPYCNELCYKEVVVYTNWNINSKIYLYYKTFSVIIVPPAEIYVLNMNLFVLCHCLFIIKLSLPFKGLSLGAFSSVSTLFAKVYVLVYSVQGVKNTSVRMFLATIYLGNDSMFSLELLYNCLWEVFVGIYCMVANDLLAQTRW